MFYLLLFHTSTVYYENRTGLHIPFLDILLIPRGGEKGAKAPYELRYSFTLYRFGYLDD